MQYLALIAAFILVGSMIYYGMQHRKKRIEAFDDIKDRARKLRERQ